jgi:hypothetical protein
MTVEALQAKREQILKTIGTVRVQFGERNVEFSRQQDALALVDAEIAKQSPQARQFTIQTKRGLE